MRCGFPDRVGNLASRRWRTAREPPDDYGDLHLLAVSPCINAGDPAYLPAAGEVDIDGEPRVRNGRIDIGADETDEWRPGDITRDGKVNIFDLQVMAGNWNKPQKGRGE